MNRHPDPRRLALRSTVRVFALEQGHLVSAARERWLRSMLARLGVAVRVTATEIVCQHVWPDLDARVRRVVADNVELRALPLATARRR